MKIQDKADTMVHKATKTVAVHNKVPADQGFKYGWGSGSWWASMGSTLYGSENDKIMVLSTIVTLEETKMLGHKVDEIIATIDRY